MQTRARALLAVATVATVAFILVIATRAPTYVPTPEPTPPPNLTASPPIVVTTDNVTINGVRITSSGSSGVGVRAAGTATHPIKNLTIQNCLIEGFDIGILAEHVENLVIKGCIIEDADYAGIGVYSGVGGRVSGNTIRRIGYARTDLTVPDVGNNAYGITFDRHTAGTDFTTDPRSADFLVDGNIVEDVPLWHCLDTHAGLRITFSANTARRCPRAIFITGDSVANRPQDITITANRLEEAVHKTGGADPVGITLVSLQGGAVLNNLISTSYPTPWVYDYIAPGSSGSVDVTIAGQQGIP